MQEAAQQEAEAVEIDIYLPHGNKQSIYIMSTDQTEDVLEVSDFVTSMSSFFIVIHFL